MFTKKSYPIVSRIVTDILNSINNLQEKEFQFLKELIYKETGIFLAPHKKIMLQSRLNIRLRMNKIEGFAAYVNRLKTDRAFFKTEVHEIINRVTTNKTDFFRENHHFDYLKKTYFPGIEEKAQKTYSRKLRFWCAACSSGEEPYSLAITIKEYFAGKTGWDIRIIASDIDTNILNIASKGEYKEDRVAPVRKDLRLKYFTEKKVNDEKIYTVKPELKAMIQFKKINLLDSPIPLHEKMNLIFCRNVIIYFDKKTQAELFSNMAKIMSDNGILIIGHSETLFGISNQFKFLGQTIYQKKLAG